MKRPKKGNVKPAVVKPLEVEEVTVKTVEYHELDRFVTDMFGQDYNCARAEEWSNDSDHLIEVDGDLSEDDRKKWTSGKAPEKTVPLGYTCS